jgi:hypothetical protein
LVPAEKSAFFSTSLDRRRASRWGFAALVVGSALALGSVHTLTLCVVAVVAAAVAGLQLWDAHPLPARRPAKVVVAVGAVLVAWTFLQQVPMPISWLAAIAPANADVWSRALSPLKEPGPSWAPISLDPTATRVQVLRGIVYLVVFLCALRIASRSTGIKFLERTLLASAVAMGLAAVLHPLFGMERVFGVFTPETAEFGTRIAPLLNSNHLSAYLNLGSCIALGWALSRHSRVPRAVPVALYLVLVGVQIFVASRAGVAAMLLGSALVLWLAHRAQRDGRALPWRFVLPGALAVLLVTVSVVLMRGRVVDDLTSNDTFKLQLIARAAGMLPSFASTGIGRGAFESVFPAFRADGEGHVVFTHPENILAQWAVEWGPPVGATALLVLAVCLRPKVALARSSVPTGPAAGLIAVTAHNLLDFSSEVPAVVIGIAVCAACVSGGAASLPRNPPAAWWSRAPRATTAVLAAATLGGALLACAGRGRELADDQRALRALALEDALPRRAFLDAARHAMLRHPAEPYLPLMGAVRAARVRDESPIPWIARSLERANVYGRAHLLLARVLARRSPAQARLEYRLAMEQDFGLATTATREGAALVETADDLMQLVPESRLAEQTLVSLEKLLRPRVPAVADRALDELARRDPDSEVVARALAANALEALRRPSPACEADRSGCLQAARDAAARLRILAPGECEGHRFAAEVEAEAGDAAGAYERLDRALDGLAERGPCLSFLVTLAKRSGNTLRVRAALDRMVGGGCSSEQQCIDLYLSAAQTAETFGQLRQALAFAKKAHLHAPAHDGSLAAVARLAEATGAYAEAVQAYEALTSREPGNLTWQEGLARSRAGLSAARSRALGLSE